MSIFHFLQLKNRKSSVQSSEVANSSELGEETQEYRKRKNEGDTQGSEDHDSKRAKSGGGFVSSLFGKNPEIPAIAR